MSDLGSTLGQILAGLTSQVTTRALSTDPSLQARLHGLDGRVLEIQCTLPASNWHLIVADGGIQTLAGQAPSPNVIVRGSAIELGSWLQPGHPQGQLEITGDNTLLLELTDIFKGFEPDLATPLSQVIGQDAAATLLGTAEVGLLGIRSLFSSVGQAMQDQAVNRFVQSDQLDSLLSGIDKLRLRVDRLAARITQQELNRH